MFDVPQPNKALLVTRLLLWVMDVLNIYCLHLIYQMKMSWSMSNWRKTPATLNMGWDFSTGDSRLWKRELLWKLVLHSMWTLGLLGVMCVNSRESDWELELVSLLPARVQGSFVLSRSHTSSALSTSTWEFRNIDALASKLFFLAVTGLPYSSVRCAIRNANS